MIFNGLGVVLGGMALLAGAVVAAAGKPEKALLVLGMFGGMSLALFGATWFGCRGGLVSASDRWRRLPSTR